MSFTQSNNLPSSTSTNSSTYESFSPEQHAQIAALKAVLRSRKDCTAAHHVLYNLLRGLDARRGFTPPLRQGANTNLSFIQAARSVRRLADVLGVSWRDEWKSALDAALRSAHLEDFDRSCEEGMEPSISGALWAAMKLTPHGATSNVLEHGMDCWHRYQRLIQQLGRGHVEPNWPEWLQQSGSVLLARQASQACMRDYLVNHDCGKAAVLTHGEDGRLHFPGHAERSAQLWRQARKPEEQALLMELDMLLHTAPIEAMAEFSRNRLAASLLLATFAQLQSNAHSIFGGEQSDSYKIKLKALNRRAKALLLAWGLGEAAVETQD